MPARSKKRPAPPKKQAGPSYMDLGVFRASAAQIFGGRGWQNRMSNLLGVELSTVNRWANGRTPIPRWLAVLMAAFRQLDELGALEMPVFKPVDPDEKEDEEDSDWIG